MVSRLLVFSLLLVAGLLPLHAQDGPVATSPGLILPAGSPEGHTPLPGDPFSFSMSVATAQPGGGIMATVTMSIPPGHFLYRKELGMKISAGIMSVTWPQPHVKKDPFENRDVEVFGDGSHEVGLSITGLSGSGTLDLTLDYQGCSQTTCYMPQSWEFRIPFSAGEGPRGDGDSRPGSAGSTSTPTGLYDFEKGVREKGFAWALLIAFVGGFLVSLTPCVYPMIPITLSVIGGTAGNSSFTRGLGLSTIYVAGLSLTYAVLGLLVASFGAQVRGFIQGNVFQLVMAGIFAILALSMFDLFMIQVPEGVRNRVAGFKKGGTIGIFLTGMVSGLMASPCVAAPLAGILAYIAASGSLWLGFSMLLAFAWGMGLILILIGAFSGSLNSLPKAGDWMNRVKEIYGFLLLGTALFFARPVIGAEWAQLLSAFLLAAFAGFLGLFSPPSQTPLLSERVAKCAAVVVLSVACAFAVSSATGWAGLCVGARDFGGIPKGVRENAWIDRVDEGIAVARKSGKPVFIDFRADWCSVCLGLEKNVFPRPEVARLLGEMVPVKVDATKPGGEADAEMKKFGVVGLPTLVILDASGKERPDLRVVGDISADDLVVRLKAVLRLQ